MNTDWYRKNFKKITEELDEIIEKAEVNNYNNAVPVKKDREKIREIIFDFIKKNKRIVYGGTAINYWLCKKDKEKTIYKNCPGDIEFYSPDPVKDVFRLCNIFLDEGFKNILGREAIHENTYKIFVEHTEFCDISLMGSGVAKNNVTVSEVDGILYVNPDFLLTDIFRVFSNPLHDYTFRLKKVFERFNKLRTFYYNPPIKPKQCRLTSLKNTLLEVRDFIYDKFVVNNDSVILCGTMAYEIYLQESGYLEKEKDSYNPKDHYEIVLISDKLKETSCQILKLVEKNFDKSEISIKEFNPFFQFYDRQISILYKNKPVVTVYGYNNICTQFHKLELEKKKTLQIVSFDYLMMWMNTMLFRTFPIPPKRNHYRCMIYYLFVMQVYYLKKHKLLGIEEGHLFSQFLLNCKWIAPSGMYMKKESTRKKAENKERRGPLVFEYRPEMRKVENYPQLIYVNQSGNQIIRKKDLLIKEEKYLPNNVVSKED